MKKLLFLIFICIFNCSVYASTTSAHSYVLMDSTSGRVIQSKNMNDRALIASITKIMTAVIAIESNKLEDKVKIDNTILKAYGSCLYLSVGETITLKELLYGLMLRSGNDAAVMIAKYVANDIGAFVDKMNDKAKKIGMTNTIFVNSSGLDDDGGNYSTAYDMALLTRYAMKYDVYREIVKTKNYKVKTDQNTYVWENKNKLLKYDYITGGKTGYTEKAGRTLVSSANYDNMDLIVVTIKDGDDWNTHLDLYKYAMDNYNGYRVLNKKKFKIIGNMKDDGEVYINNDIFLPLRKNETGSLISKIKLFDKSKYNNFDNIGYIEIYLDKELLYKENIYIKNIVKKKNSIISKILGWLYD